MTTRIFQYRWFSSALALAESIAYARPEYRKSLAADPTFTDALHGLSPRSPGPEPPRRSHRSLQPHLRTRPRRRPRPHQPLHPVSEKRHGPRSRSRRKQGARAGLEAAVEEGEWVNR